MALAVLDSSVLIAFLDGGDAHHRTAVSTLSSIRSQLVTPSTAYAEVLVYPYRLGESEGRRIERFFEELGVRIEPVATDIARAAARLRARNPALRLPDAIVIATGEVVGAARVLTFDSRWKGLGRRVRVL